MKLGIFAALASLATLVFAVPSPLPGSSEFYPFGFRVHALDLISTRFLPPGDIVVRDPTIIYNPSSKKYFVFSTDEGIKIFSSTSLTG